MTFGERILKFRKELNLTQNEVAEKLFVTYQAISQWENGITKPDIEILPKIAEVFGKSIDELFYDETSTKFKVKDFEENKLYIVVAKGKDLITVVDYEKKEEVKDNIEIKIEGDAVDVYSNFSVLIEGNVKGSVNAGNNVQCDVVGGSVNAGNNVQCDGVNGGVNAGNNVTCDGINGGLNAGNSVECDDICGTVTVGGNLECSSIRGNVKVGGDLGCDIIESESVEVDGKIIKLEKEETKNESNKNHIIIIK